MLEKGALARGTLELAPRAATGMAIGAQVAQPQPAAIGTADMGTEVVRGVHGTGMAVGRRHGIGPYRRRWRSLHGLWLTPRTVGLVREAHKRCGCAGAFALGLRWHGWGGQTRLRPSDMHHDEEPYDG